MAGTMTDYLPEVVRLLLRVNPERIVVFGSTAKNETHVDSDLDLLVVLDSDEIPRTYEEKLDLRVSVRRAVHSINRDIPIDLIVYTRAEYEGLMADKGSFLRELAETGKTIYEKASEGVAVLRRD